MEGFPTKHRTHRSLKNVFKENLTIWGLFCCHQLTGSTPRTFCHEEKKLLVFNTEPFKGQQQPIFVVDL